jgi:hypothetical protein
VFLTLQEEAFSDEHTNDSDSSPSLIIEEALDVQKPASHQDDDSNYRFCLNQHTEVIGFSANVQAVEMLNLSKTLTPANEELQVLLNSKEYLNYLHLNAKGFPMPNDLLFIETFSRSKNSDILRVAMSSKENMDILLNYYRKSLKFGYFLLANHQRFNTGTFKQHLETLEKHHLKVLFLRAILLNAPPEHIRVIYETASDPSMLSFVVNGVEKSAIQFALESWSLSLLPVLLELDAPLFLHDENNSFYFSLAVGAKSASNENEIWEALKWLSSLIGEPSLEDSLHIIKNVKGSNTIEKLNDLGFGITGIFPHNLAYEANDNATAKELIGEQLQNAKGNWRHYIVDVSSNSVCKNAKKEDFHWTDSELIAWYKNKLGEDKAHLDIDIELAKVSRLYVERARAFILRGEIGLPNKQIIEPAFISDITSLVNDNQWLTIESLMQETDSDSVLASVTTSMIAQSYSIQMLEKVISVGALVDYTSLVTALHMSDFNVIYWLLEQGVSFKSKDLFGREAIYWVLQLEQDAVAHEFQSELNKVSVYSDDSGLNPYELIALRCKPKSVLDELAIVKKFSIGNKLLSSINMNKCKLLAIDEGG